ncbi:uncharacterized protein LOC126672254 [Mercurialis annua]|uniref:uncharacterized protein LOC126672254 n=1 Tax=Mercurialis annua TaxID=3986 RepID=UPI0021604EFF|nr:uncharacterized protein LOC126672254 [Mercurialis annua]
MTSNIAESFNATIKSARELPVATLLEYLRVLVQEWSYKNRNIASHTMTKLTNKAEEALRENYSLARRMKVIPSVTFAVFCKYHMDPYQYCAEFFKKENLVKIYEAIVFPMPSQSDWDDAEDMEYADVLPPIGKIPAGRPKKQRLKPCHERKEKNTCSRCGNRGHNKKTCRNLPK